MTKRVWILGAGFSRPLGGPLLNDVLSLKSWHRLVARWPAIFAYHKLSRSMSQVYRLYRFGTAFKEGTATFRGHNSPGEHLFEHAEEFLVFLDRAQAGATKAELLNLAERVSNLDLGFWTHNGTLIPFDPADLVKAATRIMAAECELFVDGVDPEKNSAWLPYLKWAKTLTKDDTIITFNYDRVVEVLLKNRGLEISCIGSTSVLEATTLCKMHGSVDWAWDGSKLHRKDPEVGSPDYFPAIGVPGGSKDRMADGPFLESWANANWFLERANEVHIVGYSLPESDAKSRDRLLTSLKANDVHDLVVTLTLGSPSFATRRLKATLEMALSHRCLIGKPREPHVSRDDHLDTPTLDIREIEMWAQDLLDAHATKER